MKSFPAIFTLFLCVAAFAAPASQPATMPVNLSSPRAALLSIYAAMSAGDIAATKFCLIFEDAQEAEIYDISLTQLYAPLRLKRAMVARFGDTGAKPFGESSLEKSISESLEKARTAEIEIEADRAVVEPKKAATNPNAEGELSGVTLKHVGKEWKIVASSFSDFGADVPAKQLEMMRGMRDAINNACATTITALNRGDYQTPDQAFAAYQGQLQKAAPKKHTP